MKQPIVSRSLDVMGGTAVFAGTRIPVQTLLDYLEAGDSIDDFLEGFPSMTREQVIAFLEEAKERVIEAASGGFCSTSASIGAWHAISPGTQSKPPGRWAGPPSRTENC